MKLIAILGFLFSVNLLWSQPDLLKTFEEDANQFFAEYVKDGYVDYAFVKQSDSALKQLVGKIGNMDLSKLSDVQLQSFYINAYNLLVIEQIVQQYPVTSVKEISGFFNRARFNVGGTELTLDEIEKDILLKEYKDSRFHFVLVCGAKDCPKIWDRAYTADDLENQLVNRTKAALNDKSFFKIEPGKIGLSEIFRWNRFEFGGKKDILEFANLYRDEKVDLDTKSYYYVYDWTLNDTKFRTNSAFELANNSFRYVTSAAIPKGGMELKIFNNLYSQELNPPSSTKSRSSYLTTSVSFLYGTSNRLNVGFAARYRRVHNSFGETSAFDIFQSPDGVNSRHGLTAFGPQIRWAPVKSWTNFSIQSSLTFPIGENLSGTSESPFLDWSGPVFVTQFFNDKPIGDKFSLFTEIDLWVEEIGGSEKSNRVSTPMTVIFSWFPKKNFTLYGLLNYAPVITNPYDYYRQFGLGMKYQISRNFEVEILASDFSNKYLGDNFGQAATYNIGFRYSR